MDELLIALLSDALHGKTAERLPEEGELRGLLDAARRHGVAAAALAALPDGGGPQARMLAAKLHAVDMAQEYEGTALERAMAEAGIPAIPLKGWVAREDYPQPGLRTMGDLDLLIPPERLPQAERVMTGLGYAREEKNFTAYHVGYEKPPCVRAEVHIRLTEEACPLLDGVWERAVRLEDGRMRLSEEDGCLFLLRHAAKHALLGGIGLRYPMDLWVLLRRFSRVPVRWDTLSGGLAELGLTRFAAYSEKLAADWFGSPGATLSAGETDEETLRLWAEFVLRSGAFGDVHGSYENQLAGTSGAALAAAKLFPARRQMETRYPALRERPWMLGALWVRRLAEKLRDGDALAGARAMARVSGEERERRRKLLDGLELPGDPGLTCGRETER